MRKTWFILLFALIASMMFSGCYWQSTVSSSQVGVKLDDGISVSSIVGPGRYDSNGWFAELRPVDISVKTVGWEDPDLVTSDKQPIGLSLALSYHRNPDPSCVTKMYQTYNRELFDDGALNDLVKSRVPNSAKDNTAKMTLDQMLFGRETFSDALGTSITEEMNKICVVLDTVQVANIQADNGYMDKLKQKAQVIQDREIAQESVKTAEENVKKAKAETEYQLELARRQNEVNAELAKTYSTSPQMYRLEELKQIEKIMAAGGNSVKWIFVPEGSKIDFIGGDVGNSNVVPLAPQTTEQKPAQQ